MKYDLLKLLMFISKQTIYALILICFGHSLLLAEKTSGQSIYDVIVTVQIEKETVNKVFESIEKQTKFKFAYGEDVKSMDQELSLAYRNKTVAEVLQGITNTTGIEFRQINGTISAKVNAQYPAEVIHPEQLEKKAVVYQITGKVTDGKGDPVAGVNVLLKGTTTGTITDVDGNYTIDAEEGDVLSFSFIGFKSVDREVGNTSVIDVMLEEDLSTLEEVVILSTGYQEIPQERATGSFIHIDNDIITRQPGTNVIDRLDGITPGLLFDKRDPDNPQLRIRGVYTLSSSDQPLIVVDNFPYEGDLNSLNPNDIQDITILKDAASASIWGARAGNGVIVITTKKGKFNQKPSLSFTSSVAIREKPDLFSLPLLTSAEGIEIERVLFNEGDFDGSISSPYNPVSQAVEIFDAQRSGEITQAQADAQLAALGQYDVRNDYLKYVYQKQILQTYAGTFTTSGDNSALLFSVGYDKNLGELVGNGSERLSLRLQNSYRPLDNLNIQLGVNYTLQDGEANGGKRFGSERLGGSDIPLYTRLADDQGNSLSILQEISMSVPDSIIAREGLLDWKYRPLDEIRYADNTSKQRALLANLNLDYNLTDWLSVGVAYQYQHTTQAVSNHYNINTFFTRDLINRYTNISETDPADRFAVPKGGILDVSDGETESHGARGQLNFNHTLGEGKHELNALLGGEIREVINTIADRSRVFGYHPSRLTSADVSNERMPLFYGGSRTIPGDMKPNLMKTTDRFVSVFGNAAYTYDHRYTITASARTDYANIFGVKTKEKSTPLWSMGTAWGISNEAFYDLAFVPYLKLRTSYGYAGNIDPSVSALVVVRFLDPDDDTGLDYVDITRLPNPSLRWEKVRIFNVGLDFSILESERIRGTIEYYSKESTDVLAPTEINITLGAPLSGSQVTNSADMKGEGIDIILNSKNIQTDNFQWSSSIALSSATSKVTKEKAGNSSRNFGGVNNGRYRKSLKEGEDPFGFYTIPWGELDPQTGDPQIAFNGEVVHYDSVSALTDEDYIYHGSDVPVYYGNLLNNFTFKGLTLSANITYKLKYYFSRSTVDYSRLEDHYGAHPAYHIDYRDRWQEQGDEQATNIPSYVSSSTPNRRIAYLNSSALAEKGDHIRLEDIRISYNFSSKLMAKLPFHSLAINAAMDNLNILLWKANDRSIDPLFSDGMKSPRRIVFGLRASF